MATEALFHQDLSHDTALPPDTMELWREETQEPLVRVEAEFGGVLVVGWATPDDLRDMARGFVNAAARAVSL